MVSDSEVLVGGGDGPVAGSVLIPAILEITETAGAPSRRASGFLVQLTE